MKIFLAILKTILYTVPCSLFTGLVIVAIGLGALYPPILSVSQPFFENPTDKVVFETAQYSYKPGQSGTTYNYYLTNPAGEKKDITLRVIVYSGLIFSVILALASLITSIVFIILRKSRVDEWARTAFSISSVYAIGISITAMAIVFLVGIIFMIKAFIAAL